MNTIVVSPTSPLAAGAVSCAPLSSASASNADRTLVHVALTEGEWEKLENKSGKSNKKKLAAYINKILIEFFATNKTVVNAPIKPGQREFRHFLLPPQTAAFYQSISTLYGLPVATFVTRYVLIPAICGFNANVSMEDCATETDEAVYNLGANLIASYNERGIASYHDMVSDLKATHGEETITHDFIARFRWIYTQYCYIQFGRPNMTPAPQFFEPPTQTQYSYSFNPPNA